MGLSRVLLAISALATAASACASSPGASDGAGYGGGLGRHSGSLLMLADFGQLPPGPDSREPARRQITKREIDLTIRGIRWQDKAPRRSANDRRASERTKSLRQR